ncbi:unnamed protein product [Lota lota]
MARDEELYPSQRLLGESDSIPNQIGRRALVAASALRAFYSSGSTGFFLARAGPPVLRRRGPLLEPARRDATATVETRSPRLRFLTGRGGQQQ